MISINDIKEQFSRRIQDQPQYYEYMLKELLSVQDSGYYF